MRLPHFVPQGEFDDIQVNQNDTYPDADAVEDAEISDHKLPSAPDDANGNEPEEVKAEINPRKETSTFFDVYIPEYVTRRTAINRDTPLGRQRQRIAGS